MNSQIDVRDHSKPHLDERHYGQGFKQASLKSSMLTHTKDLNTESWRTPQLILHPFYLEYVKVGISI